MLKDNYETGQKGEEIAVNYLIKQGYKILDRNWHYSKNAEIDIIAEKKDCIIFVEVKTRKSLNYGHPFEAISINKIRHICRTALYYLHCNGLPDSTAVRFDVISIVGEEVSLIKDAFSFQC